MPKVLNYYQVGKMIPEGAVYIGRGNSKLGLPHSKFANPFKMDFEDQRTTVVANYRTWLWEEIKRGKITLEDLFELDGRDLVCYCAPKSCHGDILLKAIQWAKTKLGENNE